MKALLTLFGCFIFFAQTLFAQECCNNTYRSGDVRVVNQRKGTPGPDKQFSEDFVCSSCFHFVQFAVYNAGITRSAIKAPKGIGDVWLIRHNQTYLRGSAHQGAIYMVKAFANEVEAKQFARDCKRKGLDCWYNPQLNGIQFELLSMSR